MDYVFKRDISGQALARFSMEHLAIGRWFTEELVTPEKIEIVLAKLHDIEQGKLAEYYQAGFELGLRIRNDGVSVSPKVADSDRLFTMGDPIESNSNNSSWDHESQYTDGSELNEGFDHDADGNTELYQQECHAECGILDFKEALIAWLSYIKGVSK